jgi:hypothetical protein
VSAASSSNSIGHLLAERTFKIQAGQRKLRAASRCRDVDPAGFRWMQITPISPAAAGDGGFDPGP